MKHQIRHFRFTRDAWEGGLKPWLAAHGTDALQGAQSWIVTADPAQAVWIRREAAFAGIPLLGIRFLTAGSLRRELCRLLQVEARLLGRESLEFLLKLEAEKHSSPQALAVARDPGPCLAALDDLGRAGWSGAESDMGEIPSPVIEWLKVLERSRAWTSTLDRELLVRAGAAAAQALHLCFWGWDSRYYPEKVLLQSAGAAATSLVFFVPSPSFDPESNDPDMEWLEDLESLWSVEKEACPDSGYSSENLPLVDYLFRRGDTEEKPAPPLLLIGERQGDQLDLVERQILQWLPQCTRQDRIGVLVQRMQGNAAELMARLERAGIPVHDEAGSRVPGDAGARLLRRLAAYYHSNGQVDDFFQLLAELHLARPDAGYDPVQIRPKLHGIFAECQSRLMSQLLERAVKKEAPVLRKALQLASALGSWPDTGAWEEHKQRWRDAVSLLEGDVGCLEPLWSRLDATMAGRTVPGRIFLEYISALLDSERYRRQPENNLPFAKVTVLPLSKAFGQEWKHLIFLDCNEGVWPPVREENPFLDDALRKDLNARAGGRQGRLLTSLEQGALERRRLMELLENCRGSTALAAQQCGTLDPSKKLYPNEWMLQALLLQGGNGKMLQRWETLVRRRIAPPAGHRKPDVLDPVERAHLAEVRGRRTNPETPFDEYSFCYPAGPQSGRTWAVTQLGNVLDFPGACALKVLFDAESSGGFDFKRSEKWIVGILAHEWLKRCDISGTPEPRALLEKADKLEAVLRDAYIPLSARRTLWWDSIFRMARWSVIQCLRQVSEHMARGTWVVEQEQGIEAELETASGLISLRGRMDLVLRSTQAWENAEVVIIDFKTGKAELPTPAKLAEGDGMQFGVYMLMALARGASGVSVHSINPHFPGRRVLTGEHAEEARTGLDLITAVLASNRFGWMGPLTSEHKAVEVLPMATLPVAEAVLQAKCALTRTGGGS